MHYMGEKRLGRAPRDLKIYEFAWAFRKLPDEIRRMSLEDFGWMQIVPEAKRLADEELMRRAKERQ